MLKLLVWMNIWEVEEIRNDYISSVGRIMVILGQVYIRALDGLISLISDDSQWFYQTVSISDTDQ